MTAINIQHLETLNDLVSRVTGVRVRETVPDTFLDRAAEVTRTEVTKMRWALGLHGLASVALGVMILAWPGISVYALTIVFGAYTLATGIVELGTAFTSQAKEERGWLILNSGIIGK